MKSTQIFIVLCACVFIFSCIEEIPLETQTTFDEVLIIESTITDELKTQTIHLSKSFRLDAEGPNLVSNATVAVKDELGNNYIFSETEPGVYSSAIQFAAQPNIKYSLEVIENGITYTSTQESFSQPTQIDQLYLERDFNENNQEGISIYVDTFDPTGNSKRYRYEYEETYKIIAPRYSLFELIDLEAPLPVLLSNFNNIQEIQDYFVSLVPREEQVRICYNTTNSNTIIITDTNNFPEDRLEQHRVRFISRNNPIMSHRYSILVKQFVQSPAAYNFYQVLKEFSISESVFSENQPGFLEGNLSVSAGNDNKKVAGFFEVNPTDSKRIFFNYDDEFPNEARPPYFIPCTAEMYPLLFRVDPTPAIPPRIIESDVVDILRNEYIYLDQNPGDNANFLPPLHPFVMVQRPCGDCTALGSTTVPDFWVE